MVYHSQSIHGASSAIVSMTYVISVPALLYFCEKKNKLCLIIYHHKLTINKSTVSSSDHLIIKLFNILYIEY
jgi:hypothetical protein